MKRIVGIVFFVAVALIALVQMKSCSDEQGRGEKIPADVRRELDSLRLFRRVYDSLQTTDSIARQRDSVLRLDQQRKAQLAEISARRSRQTADSLAAIAQSAAEWRAAHDERQREANEWEQSAARKEVALNLEIAAHGRTKFMLMEAQARQRFLEDRTVPSLVRVTETLEKPCKLWVVPCPSRTVVGVLSAATGVVGGFVLGRSQK